jgi:hypothetical protein
MRTPTPDTQHLSPRKPSAPTPNTQHPSPRKGIGGPKTAEGKRKAAMNSMKHGLYAESEDGLAVIAQQVGASFEDVFEKMAEVYRPIDYVEALLVRRAARSAWRLMLTETLENNALSNRTCGLKRRLVPAQETVIARERLIELQLHRALAALRKKRDEDDYLRNELNSMLFSRSNEEEYELESVPSEDGLPCEENPEF